MALRVHLSTRRVPDSNGCTQLCRLVPNHSANAPHSASTSHFITQSTELGPKTAVRDYTSFTRTPLICRGFRALFAAIVLLALVGVLPAAATTSRTARTIDTIRLTLAFACIHTYEGSWTANTGNGYYGGLQMDSAFERAYGRALLRRYGHANHWPPAQQVAVAIRAFRSGRDFGPWPNTRKRCGL